MDGNLTGPDLVDHLRAVPNDELGLWVGTVRVVGLAGVRFSDDAAAILEEAARRLQAPENDEAPPG